MWCGSYGRDRVQKVFWERKITQKDIVSTTKILLFAPEPHQRKLLSESCNTETTDLIRTDVDFQCSMTNIPRGDNEYDYVVANHVLEHITEDIAAMTEIYRVLKPNGSAILMVPLYDIEEIYEDYSITSEVEREIHFGQWDHVRKYNIQGFTGRLEQSGFTVTCDKVVSDRFRQTYGIYDDDIIFVATKNAAP